MGKGANLAMGLNPHTLCSDTHLLAGQIEDARAYLRRRFDSADYELLAGALGILDDAVLLGAPMVDVLLTDHFR